MARCWQKHSAIIEIFRIGSGPSLGVQNPALRNSLAFVTGYPDLAFGHVTCRKIDQKWRASGHGRCRRNGVGPQKTGSSAKGRDNATWPAPITKGQGD